jgi:DDE superfamily endonuclease
MNELLSAHTPLRDFRAALYGCFTRRADALFDLADALLTADAVPSPVHLSLVPAHRRGWGSLYAALAHGRIDVPALRARLADHPLADGQPIYAVDCSVWVRDDAETSPERGFYYHPSRHSAGQPIVAGWSYQWVAQLSFTRDSWTAPLDVERVPPADDADEVAIRQVRRLCRRLPADGPVPLLAFDAGYDPVPLSLGLADTRAAILVRLRSDRCCYADPTSQPRTGRPRRHGAKFACADPATWPPPSDEICTEDRLYGTVRVRAWAGLHPKQQRHAARGTRKTRPVVRGTLVLVEVGRLPRATRVPKQLWLWWAGPGTPDLDVLWRAYVHRFDVEHTLRFAKQSLLWTTPRVRHPEQADRWTWLVVIAYTMLRLAKTLVRDQRLPWERPRSPHRLTPYRVRRAVSALLPSLGTPADPPKPCGRSSGRPKGRRSGPAPRHPAIKKAA